MTQQELFQAIPIEKMHLLNKEELILLLAHEQEYRIKFQKEVEYFRSLKGELMERIFLIGEKIFLIKNKFFGKSSERSSLQKSQENKKEDGKIFKKTKKEKKSKVQLPSLRYPNAPLIEKDVDFEAPPSCPCCSSEMLDSGMTEDSEYLTVIPAQFLVVRQKRHKYRCGKCHGNIQTAPSIPRIKPGSSYSDEMIQDIALSKYCDLIPIERYTSIAGRNGLKDLPQNSLIEATHNLSDFVQGAYDKLKTEITSSRILHADETPHRMLEGDKKTNWFLWGFSNKETSYFEAHNNRSGDVASELLIKSKCEFLISDVFSGYHKAVVDTNKARELINEETKLNLPILTNLYCNAHARRKFKEANFNFPEESNFFIDSYKEIYSLEALILGNSEEDALLLREQMKPHFESMRTKAMKLLPSCSTKSSIGKALSYFLKNYSQFIFFLKDPDLPIDNNPQERLLRNPVIGRKTWYGNHSIRGAQTSSVLFSLVESCKLNKINPREYFKNLVQDLNQGKQAYTPKEFKDLSNKT